MKSHIRTLLAGILLLVFLYSGWQLFRIYGDYRAAEEQYTALEEYISPPAVSSRPDPAPTNTEPEEGAVEEDPLPSEEPLWPRVDFEALAEINPDIVGWLTIEGTAVNYPVVQGEDNDYYLNHRFDRKRSGAGCLFLDVKNGADFGDPNQIVYGHYRKDHTMFRELVNYKEQEFFDAHPTGWLVTPTAVYRLEFFSGYVSDVYGEAWKTEFSGSEYPQWLASCREKSAFFSAVVPTAKERVLTLSTCSYEFDNARFVLHAVLIEQT